MKKPQTPSADTTIPPRTADEEDRLLPRSEVLARLRGMNRSTLWRLVRQGHFPPPIQLTPGLQAWRSSTVSAWIAAREARPLKGRTYFGREQVNAGTPAQAIR
jgi:predicted DNA-binding transcriptional regulator AlpA